LALPEQGKTKMRRKFTAFLLAAAVGFGLLGLAASAGRAASAPSGEAQEWNRLVEAAKREGRLNLAGPRGDDTRRALTETFTKKYGIQVEFFGAAGPELPPRIMTERRANVYYWDVIIAGTTSLLYALKAGKVLEPIESALVLPEVRDVKYWRGGELPFFDKDRVGLAIARQASGSLYVNTKQVKQLEINSWRYLLRPEFKGKVLIGRDPRLAGSGRAVFLFFYVHKALGPDFIRQLAKQDLVLMQDDRIAATWLAQGKYPICICSPRQTERLMKEGLPVQAIDGRQLKEGVHVTSGAANIAFVNRAPHPNAAKLFINWVLSKEGSTLYAKANGVPSLRVDVPADHVEQWNIPLPEWPVTNTEEALGAEEPALALLKELLGPL
jgi:iron(III) transport system substrate-binding protein